MEPTTNAIVDTLVAVIEAIRSLPPTERRWALARLTTASYRASRDSDSRLDWERIAYACAAGAAAHRNTLLDLDEAADSEPSVE